jgi:NAD(P)-dependent dehydrogenase (short-subunit alcohol dehydrogenase family)
VLAEHHEHSAASRSWTVDLAELPNIPSFAAQVIDELGGLDVLINNAGIPKRRTVMALRFDEVEYVNRINYLSPVALTIELLPELIASSGEIINISSVAARLSPPAEAA